MSTITKRILIGILQGFILSLLYHISESTPPLWPATNPSIFLSLLMVALFVPLLIIQSMGNMRAKTLLIWASSASIILFGITWYAVFRHTDVISLSAATAPAFFSVFFCTIIALFIAHSLILSSDHDKQIIAKYPTYFDIAWKLGVQIAFTAGFTGLFWMLLGLGSSLFSIIHLKFFANFVTHYWFMIPATSLCIAIALHITDVNPRIIHGIRTLFLVLLSALLPIITIIISLFLVSLMFTGVSLLWQTGHASTLLLTAAITLMILINTSFQDGLTPLSNIKRYSTMLACCLLAPLVTLAIYALALRVQQYGWSVSRIEAAACMIIIGAYAIGYLIAVFVGKNLKLIETSNVAVAWLILAIYLALLTPIADPARLMVANQISRLTSGKISPDKFDFKVIRQEGLRFGQQALENLQITWQGNQADDVHKQIKAALALKTQDDSLRKNIISAETRREQIIVDTKDHPIPDSFYKQDWNQKENAAYILRPDCLTRKGEICHAWMIQDQKKSDMVLILNYHDLVGFQQNEKGIWVLAGRWYVPECKKQEVLKGNFKMIAPEPVGDDIEIAGWRSEQLNSAARKETNPCKHN